MGHLVGRIHAALVESLDSLEDDMTEKELWEIKELNNLLNSRYLKEGKSPMVGEPLGFSEWIDKFVRHMKRLVAEAERRATDE